MPTYDYACPTCGIVEVFQSIKENALKKCPRCKKAKVQRMVSTGGGVIFKGSGFWETDYNRSSDYRTKSKSEQDAKTGGAKKDDAKKMTGSQVRKKSPTSPPWLRLRPSPSPSSKRPILPRPPHLRPLLPAWNSDASAAVGRGQRSLVAVCRQAGSWQRVPSFMSH